MTVTEPIEWRPDDYLNLRQTMALLGYDSMIWGTNPSRHYSKITDREPDDIRGDQPFWSPDSVREMRATVPRGTSDRKITWEDSELIRSKVFGALHPKPIQIRSVSANLARKRRQEKEGNPPLVLPPEPEKIIFGHPVYNPQDIRKYLDERPGYGNFSSGAERRGYRGGRVPKGRSKLELAAASQ